MEFLRFFVVFLGVMFLSTNAVADTKELNDAHAVLERLTSQKKVYFQNESLVRSSKYSGRECYSSMTDQTAFGKITQNIDWRAVRFVNPDPSNIWTSLPTVEMKGTFVTESGLSPTETDYFQFRFKDESSRTEALEAIAVFRSFCR